MAGESGGSPLAHPSELIDDHGRHLILQQIAERAGLQGRKKVIVVIVGS